METQHRAKVNTYVKVFKKRSTANHSKVIHVPFLIHILFLDKKNNSSNHFSNYSTVKFWASSQIRIATCWLSWWWIGLQCRRQTWVQSCLGNSMDRAWWPLSMGSQSWTTKQACTNNIDQMSLKSPKNPIINKTYTLLPSNWKIPSSKLSFYDSNGCKSCCPF